MASLELAPLLAELAWLRCGDSRHCSRGLRCLSVRPTRAATLGWPQPNLLVADRPGGTGRIARCSVPRIGVRRCRAAAEPYAGRLVMPAAQVDTKEQPALVLSAGRSSAVVDLSLFAAISLLGAALRLLSVEQWSFGLEEAATFRAVTQPVGAGAGELFGSEQGGFPAACLWLLGTPGLLRGRHSTCNTGHAGMPLPCTETHQNTSLEILIGKLNVKCWPQPDGCGRNPGATALIKPPCVAGPGHRKGAWGARGRRRMCVLGLPCGWQTSPQSRPSPPSRCHRLAVRTRLLCATRRYLHSTSRPA